MLSYPHPISCSHALLTPSLHLKGGLPLPLLPSTTDTYTLFVILSFPIRSTCPNHFNTFRSTLLLNFSDTPTLSLTTSFRTLSILVTPHILLRHFISATSSFSLSSTFRPQDSDPYITVGTTTLSYNSLFTLTVTLLPLHTLFIAPNALIPSPNLMLTSSFTPPSLLKQLPRYLKEFTTSNLSPLSIMLPSDGSSLTPTHIILLLPAFTLSFRLSHTLPNSRTRHCSCSADSATNAVSSAKSN